MLALVLLFCASRSFLSRTVNAWIGIVSALFAVPVVILAVAETAAGWSEDIKGNHYFEILGFLAAGCALLAGYAGGTHNGVVADFRYLPRKGLAGNGVNGDFRRLPDGYIHDVSFIHVNFSGDH